MAHITIEYSANLADHHDIDGLVAAVHAAATDQDFGPADGLRTRAARRDHYRVAGGDPRNAFVAIAVRVGPGRSVAVRQAFLAAVLDAAEGYVTAGDGPPAVAWSAELSEIDADFRINRNRVREPLAGTAERP